MTTFQHSVACTVSRYEVPCVICSSPIGIGDRMFPFLTPPQITAGGNATEVVNKKQSLVWGHESCYHPNLPPPPACRHWTRLGRCPAREMGLCAFLHDDRERLAADKTEHSPKRRWGGKRKFVRNQHKNSVFRIFLMQTYGQDYLVDDNTVILDVAGGKGELSWELINLTGVKECVVIDPRPLNLELCRSKWEKGLFDPKRTGPVFSKWYPACEDNCKLRKPRSPRHIRCFFNSEKLLDFMSVGDRKANNTNASENVSLKNTESLDLWFRDELEKARTISWTKKGLLHEDGLPYNEEFDSDTTAKENGNGTTTASYQKDKNETELSEIKDPKVARSILERCNLIVGFHPDQAAGEIVEFASALGVPWCVVPCCVYSESFPRRRLQNGSHVKSYDQFVEWLRQRHPRAKTALLDLEGKNKVIYTLPET